MKKNLSIIFLILFLFSFGQTKTIYVNENLELISEKEFNKNKSEGHLTYLYSQYVTDTLIVKTKAKRDIRGILSDRIYNRIKDNINYISKEKKVLEKDIIVINYYPGLDNCNINVNSNVMSEKNYEYIRRLNNFDKIKQFYIYKDIGNTKSYGKKLKWYQDPHSIFEKLFFKIHYPCGSYVIIFPDKTYVSYYGEYMLESIFDELEFKKRLDKKNRKN